MNMSIKQAIKDYECGLSIVKSADKNGVAKTTLQRHLKKLGISRKYTKRIKKFKDIQGKRFGKWSVIEPQEAEQGRVLWLCKCECGNKQKIRESHLLNGKSQMCGSCAMTGERSCSWKGCGKLSGTYWKRLKANALRRKSGSLEFSISINYAWKVYQLQNEKCALSGIDIPMPDKVEQGFIASLDRIDSSKGYVEGNIQWVHKDVNVMKWNLDQNYFLTLCKFITENRRI